MAEEFGFEEQKVIWKSYIGRWLLFKLSGNIEAGRVDRITSEYLMLRPHQGMIKRDGRLVNAIVDRDAGVPLHSDPIFREVTEEELECSCNQLNRQTEKNKWYDRWYSKIKSFLKNQRS